jgi:sugar phosphate isomerase/epimerase
MPTTTRRQFIQGVTAAAVAASVPAGLQPLAARQGAARSPWRSRIGLQLYTVRDVLPADFEGTLAKVAAIGYREVEATSYNNLSPKAFRAMLDRHSLAMPSTHVPAIGDGAALERALEGFQIMGVKYTQIQAAAPRPAPGRPANLPPGAYYNPATGVVRNSFTEAEAFGPHQPPESLDSVKRRAAQLNAHGRIAQKFGMKMLVHNHTGEFERLTDSPRTTMDVLLADTDPSLVTMQLDLAWTYIAGFDPLAMFEAHPGRFELWHIKDVVGLKTVNPSLGPNARVSSVAFVPVGAGNIEWRPLFAQAPRAGLKHFVVEQDNAAVWGNSLAAARVSYDNLAAVLEDL